MGWVRPAEFLRGLGRVDARWADVTLPNGATPSRFPGRACEVRETAGSKLPDAGPAGAVRTIQTKKLGIEMSKVVSELKYSAEHEWVAADGSGPATIGISAVATDALGDIVYVDLPEVGSAVTAGETCGEVESTKSVSDLYSPVTGEITEINDAVVSDPAVINNDPYGAGWLFKVAVESEGPLLSAEEYASKNGGEL